MENAVQFIYNYCQQLDKTSIYLIIRNNYYLFKVEHELQLTLNR